MFTKMNKKVITSILLTTPSLACASGGDVLSLLWLSFLVFIVVLISLFLTKFTTKQKLHIFLVYLAAALIGFMATSGLPYTKNIYLINTINTALPLLAWASIYVYYIKNKKT